MTDTQQTTNEGRGKADVKLADLLEGEVKATGADIPEGSYGCILFAFGEPFTLKNEKFRKPGEPETRTLFDLRFAILDKQGGVAELTKMTGVPDGGINRKSNLYKYLKALRPEKFTKEGDIIKGTKLKDFIGSIGVLGVGKNKDEWPEITSISGPADGVKCPTMEQCKELLSSSQGIPF